MTIERMEAGPAESSENPRHPDISVSSVRSDIADVLRQKTATLLAAGWIKAGKIAQGLDALRSHHCDISSDPTITSLVEKTAHTLLETEDYDAYCAAMIMLRKNPAEALQRRYIEMVINPQPDQNIFSLENTYKKYVGKKFMLSADASDHIETLLAQGKESLAAHLLMLLEKPRPLSIQDLALIAAQKGDSIAYQCAERWGLQQEAKKYLSNVHLEAEANLNNEDLRSALYAMSTIEWNFDDNLNLRERLCNYARSFRAAAIVDEASFRQFAVSTEYNADLSAILSIHGMFMKIGDFQDVTESCRFHLQKNAYAAYGFANAEAIAADAERLAALAENCSPEELAQAYDIFEHYIDELMKIIRVKTSHHPTAWPLQCFMDTDATPDILLLKQYLRYSKIDHWQNMLEKLDRLYIVGFAEEIREMFVTADDETIDAFLQNADSLIPYSQRCVLVGRTDLLRKEVEENIGRKKNFSDAYDDFLLLPDHAQQELHAKLHTSARRHLRNSIQDLSNLRFKNPEKWQQIQKLKKGIYDVLQRVIRCAHILTSSSHLEEEDAKNLQHICELVQAFPDDYKIMAEKDMTAALDSLYTLIAQSQLKIHMPLGGEERFRD